MPSKVKSKVIPSYVRFKPEKYVWRRGINYRKHPSAYRVGKGEQGVLICEPYKSEILPLWRFKNSKMALESSRKIFALFKLYLKNNDFVGADLARKYLQMGYTRARRYANYKGGRKYKKLKRGFELLAKGTGDKEKAIAASHFFRAWKKAESVQKYQKAKKAWRLKYG